VAQLALAAAAQNGATLADVRARGYLACGVGEGGLIGFSVRGADGAWSGFDVDFCRAIAAAVFDDPARVRFVPLSATARFEALRAGDIDVLSRNTTWTYSRDTELDIDFGAITYFDGQGYMAHRAARAGSVLDLPRGALVCAVTGTTSIEMAEEFSAGRDLGHRVQGHPDLPSAGAAYARGDCDAITSDMSGLSALRANWQRAEEHVLLPELISREPLGPAVRGGDQRWAALVRWTHYVMVAAEAEGITQTIAKERRMRSQSIDQRRLMGHDPEFGNGVGLAPDWAHRVLVHLGNYGEVFARNLGPGTRLRMQRGANELWTRGGLQYAPPLR
jgi:general L-amino acid transport system substrate-binding protein